MIVYHRLQDDVTQATPWTTHWRSLAFTPIHICSEEVGHGGDGEISSQSRYAERTKIKTLFLLIKAVLSGIVIARTGENKTFLSQDVSLWCHAFLSCENMFKLVISYRFVQSNAKSAALHINMRLTVGAWGRLFFLWRWFENLVARRKLQLITS